ncbi:MAG: S41 family peptidase, partial [Halobacteriaceae archaeon]
DRQVGGPRPETTAATIEALPSMTATLEAMAEEMQAAGTETLVVDLRANTGGDSQFVFYLAALLGGLDAINRSIEGLEVVRRRTDAYRERYGDTGPGRARDNPADYDFTQAFAASTVETGLPPLVEGLLSRSDTGMAFIDGCPDGGRYRPETIVVAVSAGTMSSAFGAAAQLARLGAEIVGVPPGQGPISFGEHVEQALPNTGLDVRLAATLFQWVSEPDGPVLEPDVPLGVDEFEAFDCAADAGLRLALEHAGHGREPPTPGTGTME